MLKLGKLITAADEFNIFILETKAIKRLEIGTSTSKWHDVHSTILYGEYKRQVLRTFGDSRLGELYKDTIHNAKTMGAATQINTRWENGIFFKEETKYLSDNEYYGYTEKSGKFHSEVCKYAGITVEVYLYDENYDVDLSPLNHRKYKRGDVRLCNREQQTISHVRDNCMYLAALFEDLFRSYTRASIDMNSEEALCKLLYGERNLPVLISAKDGRGSVKPKALNALAKLKKEPPSQAFRTDIKDKNGSLILRADVINNAKYPEVVFLNKYRYYAEKSKLLINLTSARED